MTWNTRTERRILGLVCAAALAIVASRTLALAESVERASVQVLVKDAETDQPISQARLTLQFREPGSTVKLKPSKMLSFSAKTNVHGRYKFMHIPKGTVLLRVTAERHQAFGKEFEVEEENQLLEVRLKKPQPLL